ncbi:MAG: DNA replication/repair protein RecF [Anaerotardibacter sp.]
MALKISEVHYQNFRNYQTYSLAEVGNLTIFIGPNAIGKTNLIEGIQLTTALHSFRNPKNQHLVTLGQTNGRVKTVITGDDRKIDIELALTDNKKEYLYNGKKKQARSIRGILPAVLFCPDDLTFIKGSQSIKRAQIDNLGSQLSKNYHVVQKDYEKIIKQKNKYLKDTVSHSYLLSINEVVATIGAQLYVLRSNLVRELSPYIQKYYRQLSGNNESVSVGYVPSWHKYETNKEIYTTFEELSKNEAKEQLISVMESQYLREHQRHLSLFGPHNDQIEFFIDGRNAGLFASQGQQRSLVLAYKMAEVALIKNKLDQNPVLLLDDVMSELDDSRRNHLMSLIDNEIQTFITSTHLAYFDESILQKADVITLGGENG